MISKTFFLYLSMKKAILLIVIGIFASLAQGQCIKKSEKLNVGFLFNYGLPKQDKVDVASIIRVSYPIIKRVSVGAEFNYTMRYGKFANSDYAGGIIFGKVNPILGFTAEIGYSYNKNVSSSRKCSNTKGLFGAIGYESKINSHWSIDFQYRILPSKLTEENVVNSKVFLIGTSYRFLK
jgi:hypothetical protein